jgi:hypothetical protein
MERFDDLGSANGLPGGLKHLEEELERQFRQGLVRDYEAEGLRPVREPTQPNDGPDERPVGRRLAD